MNDLFCHNCKQSITGYDDGIDCSECMKWFCDSCYDTDKGDGCYCHGVDDDPALCNSLLPQGD